MTCKGTLGSSLTEKGLGGPVSKLNTSNEGKLDSGLALQGHYWHRWKCDHPILLSACQAAYGVLYPVLAPQFKVMQSDQRGSKGLEKLLCEERLNTLCLFTLEKTQMDLIMIFKYLESSVSLFT